MYLEAIAVVIIVFKLPEVGLALNCNLKKLKIMKYSMYRQYDTIKPEGDWSDASNEVGAQKVIE